MKKETVLRVGLTACLGETLCVPVDDGVCGRGGGDQMGTQCLGRAGFHTINDGRVLNGGTGPTLSQVLDGRRKKGVNQLLVDGGITGGR